MNSCCKTRRIPSLLLLVILAFLNLDALASFSGGNGTADDPWQISNAAELDALRNYLGSEHADKHFILVADIDLWGYGEADGWQPIGSNLTGQRFHGSVDGDGHVIRNLTVARPGSGFQGLFGSLENASIRNLDLASAHVVGLDDVGALSGRSSNSLIDGVVISGRVEGRRRIGGVVGQFGGGTVHRSGAMVEVHGQNEVGGLVGRMTGLATLVAQSHAAGQIHVVGGTAGGLVGYLDGASIADCYSQAGVSGGSIRGGLIGWVQSSNSIIARCYVAGPVSGEGSSIGGFIGSILGIASPTLIDNHWDIEATGQVEAGSAVGIIGHATEQMYQRATFARFNFNTLWQIDEGVGYPRFQDLMQYSKGPAPVEVSELDGQGTIDNPWIIRTADELHAMRQDLAGHYRLGNDIDLSATTVWDGSRGWQPIGTAVNDQPFEGSLDGNGHAIRNLRIFRPSTSHQGLFGSLRAARIRDLTLDSVDVSGGFSNTGALSGTARSSELDHVVVSGQVRGVTRVGGMVGRLESGSVIQRSQADIEVRARESAGGLVGDMGGLGTVVAQSHVKGSVLGSRQHIGGLVGRLDGGVISDCYSQAAVTGGSPRGGLIGWIQSSNSTIARCYVSGPVSGEGSSIGGFIGSVLGLTNPTLHDNHWDTETTGQDEAGWQVGVTGHTTSQMQQRSTFSGFNFNTLWQIEEGVAYPRFQDLMRYSRGPLPVDLAELQGLGTPEDPWIITTPDELHAMRQDLAGHYRLGNDIDLAATTVWDGSRGWQPIGTSVSDQPFTGSLDGNGHVIRNLRIFRLTSNQALFGSLRDATVRDLKLSSAGITGSSFNTAGLAGVSRGALIENVSITGRIRGSVGPVGGLVGRTETNNTIRYSAALVDVVGTSRRSGGLVGDMSSFTGVIEQSYVKGSVRGSLEQVGGLVGQLDGGVISDCYSQAEVNGGSARGGLIGWILSSPTISRCYASGPVSGEGGSIGGFIGSLRVLLGNPTLIDNHWDIEATGQSSTAGTTGITGQTTTQMKQQATYEQWDFSDIWSINEGISYPWLRNVARVMEVTPRVRWHDNSASGSHQVDVAGNAVWSVTSADAWIAITDAQSGAGDGQFTYAIAENPNGAPRTGTVIVTTATGSQTTVTVHQGVTEPFLAVVPGFIEHTAAASSGHQLDVLSNGSWTAVAAASWLDITSGNTGAGNAVIAYGLEPNISNRARYGTITVSDGYRSLNIRITQAAARSVAGIVSGLPGRIQIVLNGEETVEMTADGSFVFQTLLSDGEDYSVTLRQVPEDILCRTINGEGRVSGQNIDDIRIDCFTDELFRDAFVQ